jgi:hypothetical protein
MTEIAFDPDALRAKYREERRRRIRADGKERAEGTLAGLELAT